MEEGKINGLTEHSLRTLGGIADADTVLGTPVFTASGAQIVPFSKVTFGNLSGGGEYGDVKVIEEAGDRSFAGGSGSVVSVKPMGFIIDDGKNCRVVRLTDEPLDNLIEKASDVLRNVTSKRDS